MNNINEKYAHWLMQNRWLVLILSTLIVLLLASGGRFLKFDNDYRIFFDGDNPQLLAFESLQDTYTKDDTVIIVLAPKDGKVFNKETLTAVVDVTERAWQTPYSIRVDSISNFQHTSADGDDLTVADLIEEPATLTQENLDNIQNIALNEPLIIHRLLSDKSHVTTINITAEFPGIDMAKEVPKTVASVRELKHYINETYPQLDVYLSGFVMMNNAFPEAAKYDMTHLIPLAVLIILSLVFFLLRGISATLSTLVVVIFSVLAAMGSAGWSGIHLSPPVMSAPIIILTLAIADCVHILSNWLQEMRKGLSKELAMTESLRINFGPIFLTSITTAIGFLSLNFSDAPPFRSLGNISAMGVVFAWLLSVAFLPALVTLLPSRIKEKEDKQKPEGMEKLANFVITQQKKLLIGMSIVFILLVSFLPKNELNDVFVHYFDERIEFRTDTDFLLDNLTGIYAISFSLEANERGVANPEYLNQVDKFGNWLKKQPEVIHINTISDTMKRLNKNMHGDEEKWHILPDQQNLAAQYLLLYEMSLPYGLDLNNQIDIRKQATRLTATLETISTQQILELEQRIQDWMQVNTPEIKTLGSSPAVMFAHIGMKNIVNLLIGAAVALTLISFILMAALRSWRYGLISLIPNLMPAGLAFGVWAIVDGEIGLGLSVVISMTIGIVVDDTVHFLSKYLRAKREQGLSAEAAVRYAFSTVGSALWVTSVALIGGFLVISTSSFELNSSMGLVTSFVIAFALLTDFLFLPPLLITLDKWLNKEKTTV